MSNRVLKNIPQSVVSIGFLALGAVIVLAGFLLLSPLMRGSGGGSQFRTTGTIKERSGNDVLLQDGTRLRLSDAATITLTRTLSSSDVRPGERVTVVGARQADGRVRASLVAKGPIVERNPPSEQQAQAGAADSSLNGNVESAGAGELTVAINDTRRVVEVTPQTQYQFWDWGSADDVTPGRQVLAVGTGTTIASLLVQQP